MNLFFWRRRRSLEEHLRGSPKKIRVDCVDFVIRKIDLLDHMAGLNVVLQSFSVYQKAAPDLKQASQDAAQLKKFMRDFIYAGVVEPKLTLKDKDAPEGTIHVDEILKDMELSSKLCGEIIRYSRGKKKRSRTRSRAPAQ